MKLSTECPHCGRKSDKLEMVGYCEHCGGQARHGQTSPSVKSESRSQGRPVVRGRVVMVACYLASAAVLLYYQISSAMVGDDTLISLAAAEIFAEQERSRQGEQIPGRPVLSKEQLLRLAKNNKNRFLPGARSWWRRGGWTIAGSHAYRAARVVTDNWIFVAVHVFIAGAVWLRIRVFYVFGLIISPVMGSIVAVGMIVNYSLLSEECLSHWLLTRDLIVGISFASLHLFAFVACLFLAILAKNRKGT